MSNYADDATDGILVRDSAAMSGVGRYSDTVQLRDVMRSRVRSLTLEKLGLTDAWRSRSIAAALDGVRLADTMQHALHATLSASDRFDLKDASHLHLLMLLEDGLQVIDSMLSRIGNLMGDGLALAEAVTQTMSAAARMKDGVRIRERANWHARDHGAEAIKLDEATTQQAALRNRGAEALSLSDQWTQRMHAVQVAVCAMVLADEARQRLHAVQLASEDVLLSDSVTRGPGGTRDAGAAWTADANGWAMSQWTQFGFDSVACIDGKLVASNADGIFTVGEEEITMVLRTAALDMGQGALVHPLYAYLDYKLDGALAVTIEQTQRGAVVERYTYALPAEAAEVLTNGRTQFGRGLRGRHFTLEVSAVGSSAHIDHLRILFSPTTRRV